MKRLIPKHKFIKEVEADSIKQRLKENRGGKTNVALLNIARDLWNSLSDFRENRLRNIRYVFGDQWGDLVKDNCGNIVTERKRIEQKTGIALQNNVIYSKINALVGQYIAQDTEFMCFAKKESADKISQIVTDTLQTNYESNEENEVMTACLHEQLIGGLPVVKELWGSHEGEDDSYTYFVNPSYFFWRSKGTDPRMWDVDLVGEIVDYTIGELASELANSKYDYNQLLEIYKGAQEDEFDGRLMQQDRHDNLTWDWAPAKNLCRTYHIWTLEHKRRYRLHDPLDMQQPIFRIEAEDLPYYKLKNQERINEYISQGFTIDDVPQINWGQIENEFTQQRKIGEIIDQYWHCQILAPSGEVLDEYDSPYEHGGHPYSFLPHHYVNGHIYPFVNVLLDHQRHINRLITQYDKGVQESTKNMKFMPKPLLGNTSPQKFLEEAKENDNWYFYDYDEDLRGERPFVFNTQPAVQGIMEMLSLQNQYANTNSGVNEAMEGQRPNNGTAASRYAMEYQNAARALGSSMKRFESFENKVANKKLSVILQYYQEPRSITVHHANGVTDFGMFLPDPVRDIKFVATLKKVSTAPVDRARRNAYIEQLVADGLLTAAQGLQLGSYDGSADVVQVLNANQEQQMQQQAVNMKLQQEEAPQRGSAESAMSMANRMQGT